ncbi:MAG: hypothetical protein QME77_13235 [bacterium]|nr:hypothetical protein [bacterium]
MAMDNKDVARVKDLSSGELRALIQEAVEQALLELLGDPDQGLSVRDDLHARLRGSLERVRRGERGVAAQEVAKRAGFAW